MQMESEVNKVSLVPQISWYQTESHVCLEVLISDSRNVVFDVETAEDGVTSTFLFEADVGDKHYRICFQLFAGVIDEMCSHKVFANRVKVLMKKKEDDKEWSRLPFVKDSYRNSIKVNWDKMEIENDASPLGDMDMDQMMRQMEMRKMMHDMENRKVIYGETNNEEDDEDEAEDEDEEEETYSEQFGKPMKGVDADLYNNFMNNVLKTYDNEEEETQRDKLGEIMEQVRGEDGNIDMNRFEEVMKGMSLEDFQGVMDDMDPEEVEKIMGEEDNE